MGTGKVTAGPKGKMASGSFFIIHLTARAEFWSSVRNESMANHFSRGAWN